VSWVDAHAAAARIRASLKRSLISNAHYVHISYEKVQPECRVTTIGRGPRPSQPSPKVAAYQHRHRSSAMLVHLHGSIELIWAPKAGETGVRLVIQSLSAAGPLGLVNNAKRRMDGILPCGASPGL
jgi:hypothetical protein